FLLPVRSSLYPSFLLKHTAPPELYTLSLHDALPIFRAIALARQEAGESAQIGCQLHQLVAEIFVHTFCAPGPANLFRLAVGKHRSEEHTSELQSRENLVCRLLLEKKKKEKT